MSDENESEKPAKPKGGKVREGESAKDRNQRIREEAAARRRSKRDDEQRRAAPARNLDAGEMVDDALARGSHQIGIWLKKNFTVIQWVIVLGVAGGVGYQVYNARHKRSVGEASDKLVVAVAAETGSVGEVTDDGADRMTGLTDPRKHFPTEEERLKAAASAYSAASSGSLQDLAKLGQAGILFDQAKYKEALAAYEGVRDSELAKGDGDVKGRAIEGVGLSQEALGNVDGALKSFRELENSGIPGFGALGLYHQARLNYAKGDIEKAKQQLNSAMKFIQEKLKDKTRMPGRSPGYLESAARELLGVIDPAAAAALAGPASTMDPRIMERLRDESEKAGGKMSPERLQELLKQLSPEGLGQGPEGAPAPEGTPVEAPAEMEKAPAEPEPAPAPAEQAPAPAEPAPKKAPAPAKKPAAAPKAPAAPAPEAPAAPAPEPAPAPAPAPPAEPSTP